VISVDTSSCVFWDTSKPPGLRPKQYQLPSIRLAIISDISMSPLEFLKGTQANPTSLKLMEHTES